MEPTTFRQAVVRRCKQEDRIAIAAQSSVSHTMDDARGVYSNSIPFFDYLLLLRTFFFTASLFAFASLYLSNTYYAHTTYHPSFCEPFSLLRYWHFALSYCCAVHIAA